MKKETLLPDLNTTEAVASWPGFDHPNQKGMGIVLHTVSGQILQTNACFLELMALAGLASKAGEKSLKSFFNAFSDTGFDFLKSDLKEKGFHAGLLFLDANQNKKAWQVSSTMLDQEQQLAQSVFFENPHLDIGMKQFNEELKVLQEMFTHNKNSLLLIDTQGIVLKLNDACLENCLLSGSEILGAPLSKFVSSVLPGNNFLAVQLIQNTLEKEQATIELSGWGHKGELHTIKVESLLIRTHAKAKLLVSFEDITQRRLTEKQASELQHKLQITANLSDDLIRISNETNYFYFYNEAWAAKTGVKIQQLEKNKWIDFVHPDEVSEMLGKIENAFKKREKYSIQYRLKTAQQTWQVVQENGTPVKNALGQFEGYVAKTFIKTVEHKHDFKQNQAFFDWMDKAGMVRIHIDQDGNILEFNHVFAQLANWKSEDKRLNLNQIIDPAEEMLGDLVKQFFKDEALDSQEIDAIQLVKYRTAKQIQIHFKLLIKQEQNGQNTAVLIGEDLTGQAKISKELEETNRNLLDLLDSASDLVILVSHSGKVLYLNNATKLTLGYSQLETRGLQLKDLISKDLVDKTYLKLLEITELESTTRFQTVLTTKSGKKLNVLASINGKFEHGKLQAYRAMFLDETEKLKNERMQELFHHISSLSASTTNTKELYDAIYKELNLVFDAKNFFIALKDNLNNLINYTFYLDEYYGNRVYNTRKKLGKGLAEYCLRLQTPVYLEEKEILKLNQDDEIEIAGPVPTAWMAVPLRSKNFVIGLVVVQSFRQGITYERRDLEMLDFISGQVAVAIQRKQSEEQIQKQTARLNSIFESSSHIMWSFNRQFELTSFNKNYVDAVLANDLNQLQSKSKVNNKSFTGLHHEEIWSEMYTLAFDGNPQQFEIAGLDKAKKVKWWEIFLNPIFLTDGLIEEVSGIANDITAKKEVENALRLNEERFRKIFESFLDIYFQTDRMGKIILISPSIEELLGYSPSDLMGKTIDDFVDSAEKLEQGVQTLKKNGRLINFETSLMHQSGHTVEFLCNLKVLQNENGKVLGFEGVARDISDLKHATTELIEAKETAEKALEVKEQFIANMSHEIRTPMNGIIGLVDLLENTALNPKQLEYLQTVKKSSETLLTILNDILDISKLETGKMLLRPTTVNIRQTFDKLHSLYWQQSFSKNLEFRIIVDNEVPEFLQVDETRLLQILCNLVANAIKFTNTGGVVVNLQKKHNSEEPDKFSVEVSDTGIGISKDEQSSLFSYFSQVDSSITKRFGGAGLGLVITKELCKLMGGEVGVDSSTGHGSTFWFTFKAEFSPRVEQEVSTSFAKQAFTFSGERPRVLIVDDNAVNLKVASEIMKNAGCEVELAMNGVEAVSKASTGEFKIILMDIQMPVMDGISAAKTIRMIPMAYRPAIIAMTAYNLLEDKEKYMSSGLDDFIAKPIKAERLVEKVKEWVLNQSDTKNTLAFAQPQKAIALEQLEKVQSLDIEVVNQLARHIGFDMVLDTFQDFEREAEELISGSLMCLENKNYQQILSYLHTLKGNSGTLGVNKVSEWSRKIESDLKNKEDSHLAEDLTTLGGLITEFKYTYKTKIFEQNEQ